MTQSTREINQSLTALGLVATEAGEEEAPSLDETLVVLAYGHHRRPIAEGGGLGLEWSGRGR